MGLGSTDGRHQCGMGIIPLREWKIELLPQTEPGKVVVALQNRKGGRFGVIYQMEVKTP